MKKSASSPALLSSSIPFHSRNSKSKIPRVQSLNCLNYLPHNINEALPYFYTSAHATFACSTQSHDTNEANQAKDTKDLAACIASPPEILDEPNIERLRSSSKLSVDSYYSRFEEYYRVFKKKRKEKKEN